MGDLWKNIKKLFTAADQSSVNQPVIHELLTRSAKDSANYQKWNNSFVKGKLLRMLKEGYLFFLSTKGSNDEAIDFLNTPSTKGFVMHVYKTQYNKSEIIHLFDYLKERVLKLGYKSSLSDTRTYNKKDWVEQLDRHYLKPPIDLLKAGKEKMNQVFGNVMIELLYRDGNIYLLKFRATTYNDHLYSEGEDFGQLMEWVYEE